MLYRPEIALEHLRRRTSLPGQSEIHPTTSAHKPLPSSPTSPWTPLLLPWLRTLVVNGNWTPLCEQPKLVHNAFARHCEMSPQSQHQEEDGTSREEEFVGIVHNNNNDQNCAIVSRAILTGCVLDIERWERGPVPPTMTMTTAPFQRYGRLIASLRGPLSSLEIHNDGSLWWWSGDLLEAIAAAHRHTLRRLCLPHVVNLKQDTLNQFCQLEELDASGTALCSVAFCGATLRVLYAASCVGLTNEGLQHATRLEVADLCDCPKVTSILPFARTLRELYLYGAAQRIGSDQLAECPRLQVLDCCFNSCLLSLGPHAAQLRELNCCCTPLTDTELQHAKGLVKLRVDHLDIRSVAPFGSSLRVLCSNFSGLHDDGLLTATNLVCLSVHGPEITSLQPFASTLLELDADDLSGIDESALVASAPSSLIRLNVSGNTRLFRLVPFATSLRHLEAAMDSALDDDAVRCATQLVTLDCSENLAITTIEPFADTLEELVALGEARCGVMAHDRFVTENASRLHTVTVTYRCDGSRLMSESNRRTLQAYEFVEHVDQQKWVRFP